MSKSKPGKSAPLQQPRKSHGFPKSVENFTDGLVRVVEHFGWPGACLIILWRFFESNGSKEQKQQFIDIFFLGKGVEQVYPFFLMGILFSLLLLAQWFYWRQRIKVLNLEISRLSKWKSDHQEAKIGTQFLHTSGG